MANDLINGIYRLLAPLKTASRPGLHVGHSLVTGELVLVALPGAAGSHPRVPDLRAEGEVFSEIASPYVHQIVDWGSEEAFLAWEYLTAWPLSAVMDSQNVMEIGDVIRILTDAASGLGAVHSRGAIYRGLQPARIFVTRDGTARLATTSASVLTARGRVVEVGPPPETPIHYLSPEQIEGSVDSRSDIYTLGAIGYELLTGRPVYWDSDPVTLAVHILKTTPVPPSKHRPEVSPELDDLFMHCLARDPNQRPGSIPALLAHLRKLTDGAAPPYGALAEDITASSATFPLPTPSRQAPEIDSRQPADDVQDSEAESHDGSETSERGIGPDSAEVPDTAEVEGPRPNGRRPHPRSPEVIGEDQAPSRIGHGEGEPVLAERIAAHAIDADQVADELAETPDRLRYMLVAASGEAFFLPKGTVDVGRPDGDKLPAIDLEGLDHQRVTSRLHARLEWREGQWYLSDLGATNGTWVNGERLNPRATVPVAPGDRLGFANVELVLGTRG